MELTGQVWLYIVTALLGTGGGTLLAVGPGGTWAKRQVGAWMAVMVGAFFFLLYGLTGGHDGFLFLLGLLSLVSGAHAFESGRVNEELVELKSELAALRGDREKRGQCSGELAGVTVTG